MAFDYKKEYKEFYMPPKKPTIVTVPKMNYIAVRGKGDPNEENGEYKSAIGLLYGIAFTIKMSYKGQHKIAGTYDDEPATVVAMHEYAKQNGYEPDITAVRYHHEIYLSDPRKSDINKLKTVVRHPIKKKEVTSVIDSRCGLHCTGCEYIESCGCGGCIETNGHPFHGECPVAVCCQNKGFVHCGECPDIPCELLTQYSCDPEHGDTPQGARIEQCKQWIAERER